MHSPPLEWGLGIGYLVALDVLRDRGEPDNDTFTECIRAGYRVETAAGRRALAVTLALGSVLAYLHFVKPEMRPA